MRKDQADAVAIAAPATAAIAQQPRRSTQRPTGIVMLLAIAALAAACDQAAPSPVEPMEPEPQIAASAANGSVLPGSQWRLSDDGGFVDAESSTLRLRFAYDAAGRDGWFLGGESSGGGGRDGGIVELYYRPTSETRNLVFRNGQWGSIYDAMDVFEAEERAADQTDYDAPDFGSPRDAELLSHSVEESAGRLLVTSEFRFEAWRVRRTYTVYPWGDMTVHSSISVAEPGAWNYLAHRFLFAVSRSTIVNPETGQTHSWGANYQDDGETMHAFADGAPHQEYRETVRADVNRNTVLYEAGRNDAYSGFMLDDRNGNDPDLVVMNADAAIAASPFQTVTEQIGGSHYVETALFSPPWAPNKLTHADLTWFYMSTRCCPVAYGDPQTWTPSLPTWDEAFHVFMRNSLESTDYLPLWREKVRDLAAQAPQRVVGARVEVGAIDRVHHLVAAPGAEEVSFAWTREEDAPAGVDYRTVFVLENFSSLREVRIEGENAPELLAYQSPGEDIALLVLVGTQPAQPHTWRISALR